MLHYNSILDYFSFFYEQPSASSADELSSIEHWISLKLAQRIFRKNNHVEAP